MMMRTARKAALIVGAMGLFVAASAHVWAIFAGPEAYAAMGAPPNIVRTAKAGDGLAACVTTGIAFVISLWALYGISGAGVIPRLPWLRLGLSGIAAVLLLRGLIVVPVLISEPGRLQVFDYWSAGVCFGVGALYAVGVTGSLRVR
ncbi:MAG: hypothetical protein ACFB2Z_13995 [Maricaulaceae bacterium]